MNLYLITFKGHDDANVVHVHADYYYYDELFEAYKFFDRGQFTCMFPKSIVKGINLYSV